MLVHRFMMGDVEDAQIYAAVPLAAWEKSEVGRWIMEHALQVPEWRTHRTVSEFHSVVEVHADFAPEDELYFVMRWGDELHRR